MIPTPRSVVRNFRYMGKRDLLAPLRWELVRRAVLLWIMLVTAFLIVVPAVLAMGVGKLIEAFGVLVVEFFDGVGDVIVKWSGFRFLVGWAERRYDVTFAAGIIINGLNASQMITKNAGRAL